MSFRRRKMSRKHSRRHFAKHAKKMHHRNVHHFPMRGGIRF